MNNPMPNIPETGQKKRVVIIGGGFAGLKFARKLKDHQYQVVLLDDKNFHVFQPLLYQVASAGIEPSSISFPLREVFKKRHDFHIRVGRATQVDPQRKILETTIGSLPYDYLVIATGCDTNYFGNTSLAEQTMQLKTTSEALYNRNQILDSFETALNTADEAERRRLLTFVVVGAGPTGIELSGALAEMRKYVLPKDYPDLDVSLMRIILVDASPKVLGNFSEKSSAYAIKKLKGMGVEIRVNAGVVDFHDEVLTFNDHSTLETANVFWVAGVVANGLKGIDKSAYGKGNRLLVDQYNRVQGYSDIFAIGDTALLITEDYPKGHPQVVQPALQQAKNLAANLPKIDTGEPLTPFRYKNKGSLATIGRNTAVLETGKFRMQGFPAWAVWLFIHLMSIVGVKNRIFIFMDWMWSYVTYNQSLRILLKPLDKPERIIKNPSAPETEEKPERASAPSSEKIEA